MTRIVALLLVLALPLQAQRLVVAAPANSVAALDSIYNVTATAFDVLGRRSPSTRVTWRVSPMGAIAVVPDSVTRGQKAVIAGVQPGAAYAIASWARTDGITLRDSIRILVDRPRVVATSVYFRVRRTASGWVGDSVMTLDMRIGETSTCAYVIAWDRRHYPVPGRPFTMTSSEKSVATIGGHAACPDTTVNPLRVAR